jgi:hypothetical protein
MIQDVDAKDLAKVEDAFIKYMSARTVATGFYKNAQDLKNKAGEAEQAGRDVLSGAAGRVEKAVGELADETPRIRLGDDQLIVELPSDTLIVYRWNKGAERCIFPPAGEHKALTNGEGQPVFPGAHEDDRRCGQCGRIIRYPTSRIAVKA